MPIDDARPTITKPDARRNLEIGGTYNRDAIRMNFHVTSLHLDNKLAGLGEMPECFAILPWALASPIRRAGDNWQMW